MIHFERGKDPRTTMGIGLESKLDKLVEESIERHKFNMCNTSVRSEERERIIQELGVPVGLEVRDNEDGDYFLIVTCSKIGYKKEFDIQGFAFPSLGKVAAKTIGGDLVAVRPMASPKGEILYLDHVYGGGKGWKRKKRKKKT